MKYILVALFFTGNWGGPANLGDFSTREACQSAGEALMLEMKDERSLRYYSYRCIPADRR